MDHKIHIECDCHTEMVTLEKFDKEPTIYLCMWSRGHWASGGMDIRNRIRWIWRIISKGHPYADEICLDVVKARRMAETLNRLANVAERDNKILVDHDKQVTPP